MLSPKKCYITQFRTTLPTQTHHNVHSKTPHCPLKPFTLSTYTILILPIQTHYIACPNPLIHHNAHSKHCQFQTTLSNEKCNIAHSKNTPLPTQKSYIAHSRRHIATSRTILLTRHSKIPQCKLKDTILTTQRLPNETHHIAHSKNIIPGQNT